MCDSKATAKNWQTLPMAGTLDMAIADVMDNIGDQTSDNVSREYVRQNLMALVNVTRQATAQELYRAEMDSAYAEVMHHVPDTIKQTLRLQEEAYKALSKRSTANGCSHGTDTKKGDEPF